MQYFKVKPESDNVKINTRLLVKNELYTTAQYASLGHPEIIRKHFDEVNVSMKETYWFFGARFCSQFPYNS